MKIVIVGGGAAGMFAALAASKNKNDEVIILEKNEKLGKKLFISGKGRCNVTNDCSETEFFKNVVRNPKFLYSAFSEFSNQDVKELIEKNGCKLKVERGNRVFPVSDKSYDVIDALKRALKDAKVKIRLNTEVKSIELNGEVFSIKISNLGESVRTQNVGASTRQQNVGASTASPYEIITSDKVIIATGGLSYPLTGSTGDGYKFAESFGINVMEQTPSLVPFNVKEVSECKEMQGLALKNVGIKIYREDNPKKILYKDFGELLFTHFGLSGPIVLSSSCYISDEDIKGKSILSIDLKPALSEKQLDDRLLREFDENKQKKLKSVIETMLPKSMVDVFLTRLASDIAEQEKASIHEIGVSEVDRELRKEIVKLLKDFRFVLSSKRGFDEAIITRGGIDVKEINPKTMESKKVKGLYFAGEVLDIDALTGGFNIQIAASTGYAAGNYL